MKRHLIIARLIPSFVLFLLMSLLTPSVSNALIYDYTYTGNCFTTATGPYTTSNFISITISTDHLLTTTGNDFPWFTYLFTISDGVVTGKDTFPSLDSYIISYDADGLPSEWIMTYTAYDTNGMHDINSRHKHNGDTIDLAFALDRTWAFRDGTASVSGNPGIWTLTVTPDSATVPEPSTVFLFAAGLAGITAISRFKRQKNA